MARNKLGRHEETVEDCEKAIEKGGNCKYWHDYHGHLVIFFFHKSSKGVVLPLGMTTVCPKLDGAKQFVY
jgi:hypothetical protein